jgi:hypothetical protein
LYNKNVRRDVLKTVLFLHGLESKPGGTKARAIESAGYNLVNPSLPKESWSESLKIAQSCVDAEKPDIIIGSSRGGALALNVEPGSAKMILIAPAWKRFGKRDCEVPSGTIVMHCEEDDIVDYSDSIELVENASNNAALLSIGHDHRMSSPDVLEAMVELLSDF